MILKSRYFYLQPVIRNWLICTGFLKDTVITMLNFKKRHNRPPIDQFTIFLFYIHKKTLLYYYGHDNHSVICYFQYLDTKITSYKIKMPNIRGPV